MKDDDEVARRATIEVHDRKGEKLAELEARLDVIERVIEPMLVRLEAVERDVAPIHVECFWYVAFGTWRAVLPDQGFAGLVDLVEQEGREYLPYLVILFQRAIAADEGLRAMSHRLALNVGDMGRLGPGSTGEAHQVSVDLDWVSTQPARAWVHPSEILGPNASSTRDLLALARARRDRGECPGWVVARLKAAAGEE